MVDARFVKREEGGGIRGVEGPICRHTPSTAAVNGVCCTVLSVHERSHQLKEQISSYACCAAASRCSSTESMVLQVGM